MRTRLCFFAAATALAAGCSAVTVTVRDDDPIAIGAPRPAPPPAPEEPPAPAPAPAKVRVEASRIAVDEKIHFGTGSAEILEQSHTLLNEVARVLREHAEITKVRIEGHTDNQGGAAYNQRLSQQRADSVRRYLIGQGIDAGRLESQGFGLSRPVDSNDTETGRSRNRRVEFNIVAQGEGGAS
jgi:outer membrane protein OmpA-like peptidoglycan-associated protein